MANPWFKLYGTEYLADPKIQRLTASERSCWVTLLCLASMDGGVVRHCEEEYVMAHSGIDPMSPEWSKTRGVLDKFSMLGMIEVENFTCIKISNWEKRQEVYSESRDRVRKWRLKQKDNKDVTDVTLHSNGKKRIEENRRDTSVANAPQGKKKLKI